LEPIFALRALGHDCRSHHGGNNCAMIADRQCGLSLLKWAKMSPLVSCISQPPSCCRYACF
jgi:hypothetical protein